MFPAAVAPYPYFGLFADIFFQECYECFGDFSFRFAEGFFECEFEFGFIVSSFCLSYVGEYDGDVMSAGGHFGAFIEGRHFVKEWEPVAAAWVARVLIGDERDEVLLLHPWLHGIAHIVGGNERATEFFAEVPEHAIDRFVGDGHVNDEEGVLYALHAEEVRPFPVEVMAEVELAAFALCV